MMLGLVLVSFFTGEMMIRVWIFWVYWFFKGASARSQESLKFPKIKWILLIEVVIFTFQTIWLYLLHLFSAWSWIFFCVKLQHDYNKDEGRRGWWWPENAEYGDSAVSLRQKQTRALHEKISEEIFQQKNKETKGAPETQLASTELAPIFSEELPQRNKETKSAGTKETRILAPTDFQINKKKWNELTTHLMNEKINLRISNTGNGICVVCGVLLLLIKTTKRQWLLIK